MELTPEDVIVPRLIDFGTFDADPEAAIDEAFAAGEHLCVTNMGRFICIVEPYEQAETPSQTP
jgi:hypothetical protein